IKLKFGAFAPVIVAAVIFSDAVPGFVIVTFKVAVGTPSAVGPRMIGDGAIFAAGPEAGLSVNKKKLFGVPPPGVGLESVTLNVCGAVRNDPGTVIFRIVPFAEAVPPDTVNTGTLPLVLKITCVLSTNPEPVNCKGTEIN